VISGTLVRRTQLNVVGGGGVLQASKKLLSVGNQPYLVIKRSLSAYLLLLPPDDVDNCPILAGRRTSAIYYKCLA
jgi:hypothetical protein